MTNKPNSKVTVCFLVPLDSGANQAEIKTAYSTLYSQIIEFANAITRDRNVLISHTVVSPDLKDMKPVVDNPANSKLAATQAAGKEVNPAKVIVETSAESDVEAEIEANKTPQSSTSTPAPSSPELNKAIEEAVFDKIKRTGKSINIINFFITNKDKDLEVPEILKGTKLSSSDFGSWVQGTGSSIKAVTKVSRGVYRFDSSKVKVKI